MNRFVTVAGITNKRPNQGLSTRKPEYGAITPQHPSFNRRRRHVELLPCFIAACQLLTNIFNYQRVIMKSSARYGIPTFDGTMVGAEVMISLRECFADALASLLRERGLTQSEFARKIGVTPTSVSRWMNAKEVPVSQTIDRIADFFGVHPAFLFLPPGKMYPAGQGKIVFDLVKFASEAGYVIRKKDS
ncbi:MAG: helix-turn-helix transcriptional regulator [Leptolyngbyaceae bacterium]|nr:helix-turn-helix transcriptional regulator [Leptolyngbyaceae bacterium]